MKYLNSSDIEIIRNIASTKSTIRINNGEVMGNKTSFNSYKNPDAEFYEYSPYNDGESIRFVDWKVYARKERLFIKNFIQERKRVCEIFVDTSASVGCYSDYNLFFVRAVLYLCGVLLAMGEIVNLTFLNSIESYEVKYSGFDSLIKIDEIFSGIKFSGMNALPKAFAARLEYTHKNSLFFFCSDFLWEKKDIKLVLDYIDKISGPKFFFHIQGKRTDDIFNNCAQIDLVDSETGEKINLNTAELRRLIELKYLKWFDEFFTLISMKDVRYMRIFRIPEDICELFGIL